MFRLGVTCPPDRLADAIRAMRPLMTLSIAELRDRLATGEAVAEFHFSTGVQEVRRCRVFLRAADAFGGTVKAFETVEGFDEREESLDYLRNVMRRSLQIRRDVLRDVERESDVD